MKLMKRLSVYFVALFIFIPALISCGYTHNQPQPQDTVKTIEHSKVIYDTVWISSVGDLMCHGGQLEDARQPDGEYDFDPVFKLIKPFIENVNLAFANFETVMAGGKYTGYPTFNTPDSYADALKFAGFDVLTTANNHCLDRGFDGLVKTINKINKFEFYQTGTFATEEESNQILVINEKDIRIAVLAYTYGTNGINPPGGKEWSINLINISRMRDDIAEAKGFGVDKIVVCIHWGEEYQRTPNNNQKKIAKELFEAGADIIFGSHPHVIQPMETLTVKDDKGKDKKVFIIYSMGNFVSNQRKKYTDSGVIIKVQLIRERISGETVIGKIEYIPTYVSVANGFRILPVQEAINAIENKDTQSPYYFSGDYSRLKEVWKETTSQLTNPDCDIYPAELRKKF